MVCRHRLLRAECQGEPSLRANEDESSPLLVGLHPPKPSTVNLPESPEGLREQGLVSKQLLSMNRRQTFE